MNVVPEWMIYLIPLVFSLLIWDTVWTAIALWGAGRNNQKSWFICLVIFNTIGILPILYLSFFKMDKN
jgi:hypothetical protein